MTTAKTRPADRPVGPPDATAPAGYPVLLADVGGTHVRFARQPAPDAAIQDHRTFLTGEFATLADAIAAWTAEPGSAARAPIARAAIAIAAPVRAGPIRLTNTDFIIDAEAIARRFGLGDVRLMNDFEAQAWALPTLSADDFVALGRQPPDRSATMAVIGPGTGLGCAGLLRTADGWWPLPGEGGHATLSAQTDLEAAVIDRARRVGDHVSAERLVSGTGLPLLYRCLAEVRGEPADPALDDGERISQAAADSPLAAETLALFGAFLGGFAGNVALTLGARGGVWIAGGIAPKMIDRLAASPFRERFEQKGRFRTYLAPIGTAVVTRPEPALDGLAFALRHGASGPGPRR